MRHKGTPLERFYQKIVRHDSGCWIWQDVPKDNGYGTFHVNKVRWNVHKWVYLTLVGPVPEGWEIDHTCNVRLCVNPTHLEAVTLAENRRRRVERKTHCIHGHEFNEENTYWYTDDEGYRCRKCKACPTSRRQTRKVLR